VERVLIGLLIAVAFALATAWLAMSEGEDDGD